MNNFFYEKSHAYFRDSFVPFSEAQLSIASSPVLYGLSIYTVFNVNWNLTTKKLTIFRIKDHYNRLITSAKIMDFHSFIEEWTYEKFETTMFELLQRNNIQENVLVRVSVFIDELVAGTRIHGLKNSLSAYVYPVGQILPKSGINVCVSSWRRNPDNAIPSRAKINGSYVNGSLMKNEALLNGYDDAIALDEHGHVTEGTVANIFMVKNGALITPSIFSDVLEGITRDTVIKIGRELGLEIIERPIDRSELYIADEMFVCGSSARIISILSIDKRIIGKKVCGPITKKVSDMYDAVQQGNIEKFSALLTTVTTV